jgi:hypothetical protein
MDIEERLLDAYRYADEERRLYLFLGHPQLRNQFMTIALSEAQRPCNPTAAGASERSSATPWFLGRIFRRLGLSTK